MTSVAWKFHRVCQRLQVARTLCSLFRRSMGDYLDVFKETVIAVYKQKFAEPESLREKLERVLREGSYGTAATSPLFSWVGAKPGQER
jgi:hypothetical protein